MDHLEEYDTTALDKDLSAYDAARENPIERTVIRDRIVYKVAGAIDANYEQFANSFFVDQGWTDTALDVVLLGLGSAGTLAAGNTAKAILAAISTGVTGSRVSFTKNFFKEKAPEIIRARMNALRAEQWAVIYRKLGSSDDAYSLPEAERDLAAYFNAGTVKSAFDDIVAKSGEQKADAQKQLDAEIAARFGPPLLPPEDPAGHTLLQGRLRALQHGKVEAKGQQVALKPPDTPNSVACKILKLFDPVTFTDCEPALEKLSDLVKDHTDRDTTRRLNDAFDTVTKGLAISFAGPREQHG